MLSDDIISTRRSLLQGLGTGAAASLAGCASMLEGGSDDSNQGNGGSTETDPEAEYSQVSDYDSSVDATESDTYSFTAGVERQLGDETTLLNGEIQNAYVIRSNEDYSDETLEDAGLYNEILDELEQENGGYTLPTGQLLPGNNLLHLEVEVNDEEHGHQETYTFEEEISVETTPEQAFEQTWIQDRELFTKLRAQHRENDLGTVLEYGDGNEDDLTWMDVAEEDVPERMEEYDVDYEDESMEMRLTILAGSWNHEVQEITGRGPSADAHRLAFTLEKYEDVEATELVNMQHSTVLAYHRDEDKLYHVETGRGGSTKFPPEVSTLAIETPELTPMYNLEDETMIDGAVGTLAVFGQVGEYDELTNNLDLSESFIETSMEHIRDGIDMETLVNAMQYAGVSAALSPGINYNIGGEVNNPEISAGL